MTRLADLQAAFQGGVTADADAAVLPLINGSARESAQNLFRVYRYAYAARLVEVLQANFEQTWALLGDEGFDAAARGYIAAAPSRHRNARWFGDGFADFLYQYHADMPAVGDVARLDWAIATAFDAADAEIVAVDAMAMIHPQQWPGLTFRLHPSVQSIAVTTAAAQAYEALDGGQPPGDLTSGEPHRVLVWRDGTTVRYRPLPSEEAAGLAAVSAGEPFAPVCEAVAEIVGQEAGGLRAAEMLRFWLESDMITTLDVEKFTRTCVRSGIQPNIFPPSAG